MAPLKISQAQYALRAKSADPLCLAIAYRDHGQDRLTPHLTWKSSRIPSWNLSLSYQPYSQPTSCRLGGNSKRSGLEADWQVFRKEGQGVGFPRRQMAERPFFIASCLAFPFFNSSSFQNFRKIRSEVVSISKIKFLPHVVYAKNWFIDLWSIILSWCMESR